MPHSAHPKPWNRIPVPPISIPQLLLVDDDRTMRMMLHEALTQQGYDVEMREDAETALATLQKEPERYDAIILDRELPGMNGLELVAKLKANAVLASIPIVMLTGTGQPEKIQQGIDAGIHHYLVKPVENTLLQSVIESALRERQQKHMLMHALHQHGSAPKAMKHCQMNIHTLQEAEQTAYFLAACFPDPERVVVGLMELLVNAVEHGNLGLNYEKKHRLLTARHWRDELDRLALLPEHANKEVEVIYQQKEEGFLVQITDAGKGFDWKRYWHINPARATASHGRGIARARLHSFDRMAYNDAGNRVTVMVNKHSKPSKMYAW